MTAQAATILRVGRGFVEPWGPANENQLVADKIAGMSLDHLAEKNGRTRNAVEQKLSALRKVGLVPPSINGPRPSPEDRYVAACLAQGGFGAIAPARPAWRDGTMAERQVIADACYAEAATAAGGFPVANHPRTGLPLLTYPARG